MKNLTNSLKAVEAGVNPHLVLLRGKFASSASSACNFSARFSDIISRERVVSHEMFTVFSG